MALGFPEKSAQDQKKRDHFIKRDCSCEGPGMCLPLDPAFPLPVPPMCWSRPCGARGQSVLSESQPGLTNLRNEGEGEGGLLLIGRKSRNPSKMIHLGEGGARVQRETSTGGGEQLSQVSNAWKSEKVWETITSEAC